jgi:hypothetical protein
MSDFNFPRITEKRYLEISPKSFTADATTTGLLTISSTYSFKVGQLASVISSTQPVLKVKIQRVISETQLIVIAIGESVITKKTLDMSMYLLADTATIQLHEDKRPVIDLLEIQRQVYEEEPTVALRQHSVDWLGRPYSMDNPLPTDVVNKLINQPYDDIEVMTRTCDGDPLTIAVRNLGVQIMTLSLTYNCDGDFQRVRRLP